MRRSYVSAIWRSFRQSTLVVGMSLASLSSAWGVEKIGILHDRFVHVLMPQEGPRSFQNQLFTPFGVWSTLGLLQFTMPLQTHKLFPSYITKTHEDFTGGITQLFPIKGPVQYDFMMLHRQSSVFLPEVVEVFNKYMEPLSDDVAGDVARINARVKKNTEGMISTLVTPEEIAGAQRVLLSTLYFHDDWVESFKSEQFGSFYGKQKESRIVYVTSDKYTKALYSGDGYDEKGDKEILIPFRSGYQLFIQMNGELEKPVSPVSQQDLLSHRPMKAFKGKLWIPKMKVRNEVDFLAFAEPLGLSFLQQAPFFVTKMIQRNAMEITLEGASVASATVLTAKSMRRDPEIKIDRPFAWAILDAESRILMGGVQAQFEDVPLTTALRNAVPRAMPEKRRFSDDDSSEEELRYAPSLQQLPRGMVPVGALAWARESGQICKEGSDGDDSVVEGADSTAASRGSLDDDNPVTPPSSPE